MAMGRWIKGFSGAALAAAVLTASLSFSDASEKSAPLLPSALPFNVEIGGGFELTDQFGETRRLEDFSGRHILVFFGFANCESICSAALPSMAAAIDELGERGERIDTIMITVDPDRDTPEGLRASLPKFHDDLIGLTGPRDALEAVWKAFHVEVKEVARDWNDEPIYAHGSFIYLIGPDGTVQTLLPPVLPPEQMAAIIQNYL